MTSDATFHTLFSSNTSTQPSITAFCQSRSIPQRDHDTLQNLLDASRQSRSGLVIVDSDATVDRRDQQSPRFEIEANRLAGQRTMSDRQGSQSELEGDQCSGIKPVWLAVVESLSMELLAPFIVVLIRPADQTTVPIDRVWHWMRQGAVGFLKVKSRGSGSAQVDADDPTGTTGRIDAEALHSELEQIWREAQQRRRYLDRLITLRSRLGELTTRQSAILEHLMQGDTMQSIARVLHVSKRTVEMDLASIRSTFQSDSTLAVVSQATEGRLLNELLAWLPPHDRELGQSHSPFDKVPRESTTLGPA
ncbi:MAG: LuxR C-terminal-related transcriptional regulator [Planctomycetota bacterium]